jgi:hypothetical protein
MKLEEKEENDIIELYSILLQLSKKITEKNFSELKPYQQTPITLTIYNNIMALIREKGMIESTKALQGWSTGILSTILGGKK